MIEYKGRGRGNSMTSKDGRGGSGVRGIYLQRCRAGGGGGGWEKNISVEVVGKTFIISALYKIE
ncbi:MAG: hypothetical protein ABIH34_01700 [Nanoarchaeota archaeon]